MKKKGQTDTEWGLKAVTELVIGGLLIAIFLYSGNAWGTGEVFQKTRLAEDISLSIDALSATNGNGYFFYPADISKFSFKISEERIEVYDIDNDPTLGSYRFVGTKGLVIDKTFNNPERMLIGKVGDSIIVADKKINLNMLSCPDIRSEDSIADKTLLIDPGHGDGTELKNINLDESAIASTIGSSLHLAAYGKFIEIKHTRMGEIGENSARLSAHNINQLMENSDIIISIHIGSYSDERQTLKVYYSSESEAKIREKNKKLACLIANNILENEDLHFSGANMIPSDSLDIPKDKLAVFVEIGNINAAKDLNMLAKADLLSKIGIGLFQGVADFYEV